MQSKRNMDPPILSEIFKEKNRGKKKKDENLVLSPSWCLHIGTIT